MGTCMAPSYANIFMDNLERRMLAKMDAVPSTCWRYIDDVFAIWPHGKEHWIKFLEKINQFHPFIKFTAEWSAKSVLFPDTMVTVENEGCLTPDLYVKPTDTHQYLRKDSCHPSHCKRGIPYSQALRIQRICSEKEDYLRRTQELNEGLSWSVGDITRMTCKIRSIGLLDLTGSVTLLQKNEDSPWTKHSR